MNRRGFLGISLAGLSSLASFLAAVPFVRSLLPSAKAHGFICPCHRSGFDYAGRVVQGPAPTNLAIPPHRYISATKVMIGEAPPVT